MDINQQYTDEMVRFRRTFHQKPEAGWTEFRTTSIIVDRLAGLGFEVLKGKQIINPDYVMGRYASEVQLGIKRALDAGVSQEKIDSLEGYTGAVGIWKTDRPGPVTALRFDIDALYLSETQDAQHLPNQCGFASQYTGVMHACGHDCHAGVGLAIAHWIADHADQLCGTIKLLFQPAEEGTRGAMAMAQSGIVDDVDMFFASHIGCAPRLGFVTVTSPGYNATIKFDVSFEGKPAHSVANPQNGRNALMAACHTAVMIGSLPRHGDGLTTVSCGKLNAGEMRNVIPTHATMQMEVRGSTNELCQYIFSQVERAVKANAEAFDVQYKITKVGEAFTMNPTPELSELVKQCAAEVVGADHVSDYSEKGGSEDATVLMARVQQHGGQAAHFYYGANHNGQHRSDFDPDDVKSMPVGFSVLVKILEKINQSAN